MLCACAFDMSVWPVLIMCAVCFIGLEAVWYLDFDNEAFDCRMLFFFLPKLGSLHIKFGIYFRRSLVLSVIPSGSWCLLQIVMPFLLRSVLDDIDRCLTKWHGQGFTWSVCVLNFVFMLCKLVLLLDKMLFSPLFSLCVLVVVKVVLHMKLFTFMHDCILVYMTNTNWFVIQAILWR